MQPATTASVQAPPAASPHALPPPVRQSSAPAASLVHKTSNVTKNSSTPKSANVAKSSSVHVVAPGETLSKVSRAYGVSVTELARLNNIPPHTKLSIGDRLNIPGNRAARSEASKTVQPKSLNVPAKGKSEAKAASKDLPKAAPAVANQAPVERASVATDDPPSTNVVRAGNSSLSFRWPAKGRIIAGFGPKTNGQANDGINIALPEGTPIKAAEDGVVAYAGNELKGYGNLVLVRHADGYVTAYAHAKELMVKRGDPIKRGQTIARSGQTGNVDAPQLHFEIRKGPSPIDPMPLLSGG
jgi:murein DD-endopeptidase MepM/ murein hydrolase activator NlpD